MPRPQPEIDAGTIERWAQLRSEGLEEFEALVTSGHEHASDPLEFLAWVAGLPDPLEFLNEAVWRAKDADYTWVQITVALGHSAHDDRSVSNKFRRRR